MSLRGRWNYPTAIRFGAGRIAEVGAACMDLGISRPLIVTDPGIASLPFPGQILAQLEADGLPGACFSQVGTNPTVAHVEAGVAMARAGGHDGVIALGGGSALDVGKAVALMVGQARPLLDFEDKGDAWTRVDPAGMVPVVAVPTTSGTGSEVGRASVIVDEQAQAKKIIFHPGMLPGAVICDPALTVGLPPHITAATGMDALSHNLEAWCAPGFHPQADGIALEGMALIQRALVRATVQPTDMDARAMMMAASMMGATAFQKGLGAMHALAHPIGAHFHTHHGLTNAILMPYVLVANGPAIGEPMDRLTRHLGLSPGLDGVLSWVLELRKTLGIAHDLAAIGAKPTPEMGAWAAADPSASTNPIAFDGARYQRIYEAALAGDLDHARSA
jgi:alcohol dehydrogenase class IV